MCCINMYCKYEYMSLKIMRMQAGSLFDLNLAKQKRGKEKSG
jgi:hypothetical protein